MDSGTRDAAVSRTSPVRAGWMGLLTGRASHGFSGHVCLTTGRGHHVKIAAVQASEPGKGAAIMRSRGVLRRCRMRSCGPAAKMIGGYATLLLVWSVASCGTESTVELEPAFEGPPCRVGQELGPGQSCTDGSSYQFGVDSDGIACLIPDGVNRTSGICSNNDIDLEGFAASRIPDTLRWRIDSQP